MLLTKEVEVKVNSYTVDYYKSLGYEIPMKRAAETSYKRYKKEFVYDFGKTIIVKVNDLMKQSNVKVEALCDYCNEEIIVIPYSKYNREQDRVNKIACKKCAGKKRAECNLLRYSVDNYAKTSECQEKMKNTMKSLYGVEHYSQTQEYKDKFHNTCVDKYGESYRQQFADKALKSFFNKSGYDNPAQSPEVKEKMKLSCIEHYGVDNPFKSSEIKEKMKQSYIKHYGVESPSKSPVVRAKIAKTLYANGSTSTSKQQLYVFNLYNQNECAKLNYPISYYNADILLLDEKLDIEVDFGGHNLSVKIGKLTQEEFEQKEIIRNNIIKREGYKQMRIISAKDLLPSDQVLLQMLDFARNYFSQYPNHSWIEFNIDSSIVRNAEHKDGLPYSFGGLRTIKDSDINN